MKKTIYIAPENEAHFALAVKAIGMGVMPGDSLSSRLAELLRQDLRAHAHRLRKAGFAVNVEKAKGGAK